MAGPVLRNTFAALGADSANHDHDPSSTGVYSRSPVDEERRRRAILAQREALRHHMVDASSGQAGQRPSEPRPVRGTMTGLYNHTTDRANTSPLPRGAVGPYGLPTKVAYSWPTASPPTSSSVVLFSLCACTVLRIVPQYRGHLVRFRTCGGTVLLAGPRFCMCAV